MYDPELIVYLNYLVINILSSTFGQIFARYNQYVIIKVFVKEVQYFYTWGYLGVQLGL